MRDRNKHPTAAGIVIFREINNTCEILGLVALEDQQRRCTGLYDFPKGQIDPGERYFDAALRECYEETGLKPKQIIAGPFYDETMVFWLGEVNTDVTPVCGVNPDTGLCEHDGYEWITHDESI